MSPAHDFEQYLTWVGYESFSLPFEFGGATQCGRLNAHNNNQDSLAILGEHDRLVGVVCDGCSTAAGGYSQNEVGSRLLSVLVANLTNDLIRNSRVIGLLDELLSLEKAIGLQILELSKAFVKEEQRDSFLEGFFMTTIVVFAIDADDYAVFGCGDGFLAINGELKDLELQSGEYLASRLLKGRDWEGAINGGEGVLKIIAKGKTKKLNSILLASDGFADLQRQFPQLIGSFMLNSDELLIQGYKQMMAAEFRRRIWFDSAVESWAESQDSHDDRSFLLLRREGKNNKQESATCSKSRRRKSRNQADSSEHLPVSVLNT